MAEATVGEELLAQLLCANGVNRGLEEKDEFGLTPLHEACAAGNHDLVQKLLSWGANIHALTEDRRSTPLYIAAEYGKEKVVDLLLQKGAVEDLLKGDHEEDTPLHSATSNLTIFKKMFEPATQMSAVGEILNGKKKQNLLHFAAGKGNLEVVDFLIARNANLKFARDYKGAIPFHFGARNGSVAVMEKLLEDVNIDDENSVGLTALHYAAWNGHTEAVNWLLQKGASVSKREQINGNTPLHLAAKNGSAEIISTLITKGADVSARNRNGGTVLHYAASYANEEHISWVLSQIRLYTAKSKEGKDKNFELNVNRVDEDRQNALHWAAFKGNTRVIETLIKNGVGPMAQDKKGRSPLCLALIEKRLSFAEKLVECLGESLKAEDWMNVVQLWTDTFSKETQLQLLESFKAHKLSYSDQHIIQEVPHIYKALSADGQDIAKFIHKKSKGIIEFVNAQGKTSGRTALHWATILKKKNIVAMLCKEFSEDLIADMVDCEDRTPFDYATEIEIVRELRKRPEVQSHVDNLYRDRQVYVDVSNAILVGAALIAGVTFEKWLQPANNDGLEVFWIFNCFSFFFSIATVVAGACAMLPVPDHDIAKSVTNIRKNLTYAALFLVLSIVFVLGAFTAAWFATWPASLKYQREMVATLLVGTVICLVFILKFVLQLYKVRPKSSKQTLARSSSPNAMVSKEEEERKEGPVDHHPRIGLKVGKRHEYIPWDDGLDNLERRPS